MRWTANILMWILLVTVGNTVNAYSQYENIWAFGRSAGLDFTSGSPVAFKSSINASEGCASVCDVTGQLLFYTDGNLCWDRNHNLMPNGFGLNQFSTVSSAQAALIVPMPDSSSKYYVFTLSFSDDAGTPNPQARGRLNYNIVNMELNNGLGDVELDRKGVPFDSSLTEHMTGVAGDKCNIWLLVVSKYNSLKAYSIDRNGIDPNPIVTPIVVSNDSSIWGGGIGCMDVSPDRSKLAIARSYLALYDFDPATGRVYNPVILSEKDSFFNYYDTYTDYYSVCFSPDNSKLYANNGFTINGSIDQFDLSSNDSLAIVNSKTVLEDNAVFYCNLKRAPDNKIYMSTADNAVDVINFPNLAGTACQYTANAVPLVARTVGTNGLPNVVPLLHKDTIRRQFVVRGCYGNGVLLQADSSDRYYGYVWNTDAQGRTLHIAAPGRYWVGYNTSSCAAVVDTFIVLFDKHIASVDVKSGCKWDSTGVAWVSLPEGDTTIYTYTWYDSSDRLMKGPVQSGHGDTLIGITMGDYSLQVRTLTGCDTIIRFTVEALDYKTSFTSDSIVCVGSVLDFENTSKDFFASYAWYFGDGDSSALIAPVHVYGEDGRYTVYLVGYPCLDSSSRTIIVDPVPDVDIFVSDSILCEGVSAWFEARYDSIGSTGIEWDFGDGNRDDGSSVINHSYDTSGLLTVSLHASYRSCPDSVLRKQVLVNHYPSLNLGEDTSVCLNGSGIVVGDYRNNVDSSAQWRWNTGDTTSVISVRHPGIYTARVLVNGCWADDSIEVHKDCYLDIPNVFTPDGDGINDYFLPRIWLSKGLLGFKMDIYNRWGALMFETTEIDGRGWDGMLNGLDQLQGVYVYLIEILLKGGKKEHYRGNVTLLR